MTRIVYRVLKFLFVTVPFVALLFSPFIGLCALLPYPVDVVCTRMVGYAAVFSFVAVLVLYPLSRRLDKIFLD